MQINLFDITLGFIEGFALILSPCILPILPIILASSWTGSRQRPLGIMAGFVICFTLVAFFSRQLVHYSGVDLNLIRHISYGLLIILGLVMLSSYLTEQFSRITQRLSSIRTLINTQEDGFFSGFIVGTLISVVWVPCAGPILAAVIVQTVTQTTTWVSFLTLLAFACGAALPMLVIVFYGKNIMDQFSFFKTRTVFFRKLLGAVIIASVAFMIYQEKGMTIPTVQTTIQTSDNLQKGLLVPYPAPAIQGISTWINSPPLQLSTLKGKVVLVDFWTYSCINCIRTLPYLNNYYKKYHKDGLVIIGVHSPEFDFEKNETNVQDAVKRDGIQYPVALDNQFSTWRNFKNHFWPAHYLIDKDGQVVYEHFGEGDYAVTENNIRYLLGVHDLSIPSEPNKTIIVINETPETYLGYERADTDHSPSPLIHDQITNYTYPKTLALHSWALQGMWQVLTNNITSTQATASIKIHFKARQVFVVMGNNTHKPIEVTVRLNGQELKKDQGNDVTNSTIQVNKHSIYHVINLPKTTNGELELTSDSQGLEVYTFTFGE